MADSAFPALALDEHRRFWNGEDELPSWAAFQPRRGPYGACGPRGTSGAVTLVSVRTEDGRSPTLAQVAAYAYLKQHEAGIAAVVQEALFAEYPRWRRLEIDAAGPEIDHETWFELTGRRVPPPSPRRHAELRLPEISVPSELAAMCGLHSIHVLDVEREGRAYLGFELGSNWDKEHGAGVLMHGHRVVAVGQADASFHDGIAEHDASQVAPRP